MMDSPLIQRVSSGWPAQKWRDFTVLVGVSGGPDSVALARILDCLKGQTGAGQLVLVHVNHGLRGEASDQDAEFVQSLGDALARPVVIEDGKGRTDELVGDATSRGGDSLEGKLRQRRYQAFENVAAKWGARFLVTAHTLEDQVETVLFRMLRGTGVDGLAGIPFQRPLNQLVTVVRPLLDVRKAELLACLSEVGQDFRRDHSNTDPQFTRNRLRHGVLPQLRDWFSNDVDLAITKLSAQARRHQLLLERLAEPVFLECFQVRNQQILVKPLPLSEYDLELVVVAARRAWKTAGLPQRDMNTQRWYQLVEQLTAGEPTTRVAFPGNIRLCRQGDSVEIRVHSVSTDTSDAPAKTTRIQKP